jgi:hypothetical protein
MRIIHIIALKDNKKIVVRGKNEYGEYVVSFYSNGRHMDASDYFTDDKRDALDTAESAARKESCMRLHW